jgi:putative inorganic carbon (hco3(-)) transporter
VYSGTRTATMMLVMGVAFYCILTLYEKNTKKLIVASVLAFTFIMVVPIYNNAVINRVRSTFKPSEDPSYLVRDWNRNFVQPYIWSHPIGGGIYTCGLLGTIYNPGHFLSNVPPDSGYMQVLMEQGYIGLLLTLAFYFVLLRIGIQLFYRTKDPELKALNAATVVFMFTFMAGQISQIVFLPQYPGAFFVLSAFAYMMKMNYFENEEI